MLVGCKRTRSQRSSPVRSALSMTSQLQLQLLTLGCLRMMDLSVCSTGMMVVVEDVVAVVKVRNVVTGQIEMRELK